MYMYVIFWNFVHYGYVFSTVNRNENFLIERVATNRSLSRRDKALYLTFETWLLELSLGALFDVNISSSFFLVIVRVKR